MTVARAKAAARTAAFARRKAAKAEGLDKLAQGALLEYLAPFRGQVLAGYMPIRTEVDPRPLMADWGETGVVGVPVITGAGEPLEFHRWTPTAVMVDGPFGAPVPEAADPVIPQVVIVPMVAFDRDGGRLGYGGGFYDRTLEKLRRDGEVHAVGLAFAAQEAEGLPRERTDQLLDAVVTENGAMRFW